VGGRQKKGKVMALIRRNREPVPAEVVEHVREYLADNLPQYELLKVVRQSDHPDDNYLYMASAKKRNDDEYAVWTCWNETTLSLNFGHYGLVSEAVCEEVFNEFFHRISGALVID
jgi:hypothetical protein